MSVDNRKIAINILREVIYDKYSLSTVFNKHLQTASINKAFIQELCYGVLRWQLRLEALIKLLVKKPVKSKEIDVHLLLLIGFYQLLYLRIPEHAAVMETVNTAKQLNKHWATSLLNGVFRNFLRNKEAYLDALTNDEARYAHPTWLIEKIKKAWPQQWENILITNNQYPPFALRVNLQKISRAEYLIKLQQHELEYQLFPYNDCGLLIVKPMDVTQLPGFLEGEISVQDFAAQLSTPLLNLKPQLNILDACAAPGGKTCHILESEPLLTKVVAVDIDKERCVRIKENLQRLHLSAEIKSGDAANPATWWDGELFDRILLDAPCSATGVIRRHPDIKCLRRKEDISQLVALQRQLLKNVWPLLKPSGILVYTTCSILPEENHENLQWFLQNTADAESELMNVDWGHELSIGRQLLPGENNGDGFYYAILQKK